MLRQIILFSGEANMQSNPFISYSLFSGNALSLFNSLTTDQHIKLSSQLKQVCYWSPSFYTPWYLIFAEQVEFIMPKFLTHRVNQVWYLVWEPQKFTEVVKLLSRLCQQEGIASYTPLLSQESEPGITLCTWVSLWCKLLTSWYWRVVRNRYSISLLSWSHESSHLHNLHGFCMLDSVFNSSFLDESTLCFFCWTGLLLLRQLLQTLSCSVSVIHCHGFSHNSEQSELVKSGQSMARNLGSPELSDISASELLMRADLSRQSAQ